MSGYAKTPGDFEPPVIRAPLHSWIFDQNEVIVVDPEFTRRGFNRWKKTC